MLTRFLVALWIALACLSAAAAEPSQESAPQPDATASASEPSTAPPLAKPTPDAPAPPKSAAPTAGKSSTNTTNGDFKPSEEISEDMAVAYPVDI